MKDDGQIIEEYARAFEGHLAGSAQDKARRRQELVGHLSDAAEEGELAEALERLGTPASAAATFAKGATLPYAPLGRRIGAILIDHLPLIGISAALAVQAIRRGHDISLAFPPWVYQEDGGFLHGIGVPLALLWSIIILGVLEGTWGTTPGKALMGLRVVTENGLKIHVGDGVFRRVCLLLGPIAWVDWLPIVFNERRRILEHVTHTVVIGAGGDRAKAMSERQAAGGVE
ncbi:RDD family protein [Sphaerisporangium dianthi]|uniref:RDD family protein n=1 Tax=Sphaerisporangium dianthi TaxID=1436120 RepID=A0ABV9CPR9_9ACTN